MYADVEEYENAAKLAKRGLGRLSELETDLGNKLSRSVPYDQSYWPSNLTVL